MVRARPSLEDLPWAAAGYAIGRGLGYLTFHLPMRASLSRTGDGFVALAVTLIATKPSPVRARRSEEHTSELQSLMRTSYAVFCLKKKKQETEYIDITSIMHYISLTSHK